MNEFIACLLLFKTRDCFSRPRGKTKAWAVTHKTVDVDEPPGGDERHLVRAVEPPTTKKRNHSWQKDKGKKTNTHKVKPGSNPGLPAAKPTP